MPEPQRLAGIDVAHHREIRLSRFIVAPDRSAGNPV